MTAKSKLKKCPKTIGVFCSIRECADCVIKDAYEQGKSDGRKQTLEEVLKVVKFEQVEYLVDEGEYITFFHMIRNWLEHKIKAME